MWSSRERHTVALVTAVLLLCSTPAPAHHQDGHICGGSTGIRGGTGSASTSCEAEDPPQGRRVDDGCGRDSLAVERFGPPPAHLSDFYELVGVETPPPPGFTLMGGYNCAGVYVSGPYLRPDPSWDDTVVALERARARLTPAFPEPNVSPPEAVVREPTWLWLDDAAWSPATATATEGAATVTVTAVPTAVVWDMGEGTRRCDGPGRRWSPAAQAAYDAAPPAVRDSGTPACTFTFVHSSTVQPDGVHGASVTVSWEFSWTANGVPRGVFGTVDRTSDFEVRVGEVQALITGY